MFEIIKVRSASKRVIILKKKQGWLMPDKIRKMFTQIDLLIWEKLYFSLTPRVKSLFKYWLILCYLNFVFFYENII